MGRNYRYKDIQLPQLRSFCLAAQGNFTAAAEALGVSVSAVWQQVRALERHLGATLLRRRGRAVELTPEGRLLFQLVQPCVSSLDSLERLFEAGSQGLPQQLVVATTEYILLYDLPKLLQEFTATHPSVRLNLSDAAPEEVLRLIEQGQADLGVTSYDPEQPRSPYLEYEDLFERPTVLLTPTGHPLARRKHVGPLDLIPYPMLLPRRGTYSRKVLDRLLGRHNLSDRLQVVLESRNFSILCLYVELGLGIALVTVGPEVRRLMPHLHMRRFDLGMPGLPVALVVRKGVHLSEPAQEFRQIVRRFLAGRSTSHNS